MENMKDQIKKLVGIAAGLFSLVTSAGAVVASSCCVLPLALSAAGIGGTWIGGLSELVFYRSWILAAAAVALAIGWAVALRRPMITCAEDGSCTRTTRHWLTFGALGLSTLFVGVAVAWSWLEPTIFAALLRMTAGAV